MAVLTAVGLLPDPDPWETDYAKGYENAFAEMVYVISLGRQHWIECPGCPGCDVLGVLMNQVRKEAEGNETARPVTFEGEEGMLGVYFTVTKD